MVAELKVQQADEVDQRDEDAHIGGLQRCARRLVGVRELPERRGHGAAGRGRAPMQRRARARALRPARRRRGLVVT